jgi:uncharacterized protein YggE
MVLPLRSTVPARVGHAALSALAVVALSLGASRPAHAQSATSPVMETPQIAVVGTGEVRVTPDRALVVIGVETRRSTAAQAGSDNARQTRAVIDAIRAAGVATDDIATAEYSVMPDQQYDQPTRSTRIAGYIVRNTVRIRVMKLETMGAVLDAALARGANTIQSIELTSSTLPAARREALANAVEQAKADAEVMARAAGGSLGPLLEMSVQDVGTPMFEKAMVRSMAVAADAGTPIAGGQQTVQARVSARWRFLTGR